MINIHGGEYEYKVGGSLPPNALCYVTRKADHQLLKSLEAGEFCYVFNARQMGKSSLKARTIKLLEAKNIACAAVDVTKLGVKNITVDQWYKGLVFELVRAFNLAGDFDLKAWRNGQSELSSLQQLSIFIEDILLSKVLKPKICIFLEEIDNVRSLNFSTDDLFALIRAFHEQRVDNPAYKRLNFCLLGVATPSDLIADKQRTSFNIGQSIDLSGFEFADARLPLTQGLIDKVNDPEMVLQEVLDWTGGQPFLTQKLCKLVAENAESYQMNINHLVQNHVVTNWEYQDNPQHLRTIRDRLRGNGQLRGRILDLYQQILQSQAIAVDDSPEQIELQLSGLVVKKNGRLQVYNHIYESVFDKNWVKKELASLRPEFYSVALAGWIESGGQEESWLLRGQNLQQAQEWIADKKLSDDDYRFLDASREMEFQQELEISRIFAAANDTLATANDTLKRVVKKATRQKSFGFTILSISLLVAIVTGVWILQNTSIQSLSTNAILSSNQTLDASVNAVKTANRLKSILWADTNTKESIILALRTAYNKNREKNRLEGHENAVRSVSFSPDGQTIATASEDNTIRLWSIDGQERKKIIKPKQIFRSVRFSPDGKKFAAISADMTINVWDINGQELITSKGKKNDDHFMSDICFSSDSQVIVSSDRDNNIKLWNINTQQSKILKGSSEPVWSLSCSPDGNMIASADRGGVIKIWSIDGRELKTFSPQSQSIFGISFSPDSTMIASAGGDTTVRLWNLDGEELKPQGKHNLLGKHDNFVISVAFSPDGKMLASTSADNTVKLWSINRIFKDNKWVVDSKQIETLRGHGDFVFSSSFSPDGKTIATASADNTVKLWSINRLDRKTLIGQGVDSLYGVGFSPDGKIIAAGGDAVNEKKAIQLWNIEGKELKSIKIDSTESWNRVWSLNFSPDGKAIVTANSDKTIKLWSVDGQKISTPTGHQDQVIDIKFSPDGQTFASASYDGTVKIWNKNGQELRTLKSNSGKVWSVDFSPDGKKIISAHNDGTVKIWNTDGQELNSFKAHSSYVTSVRFSPDGKTIASAGRDKIIKSWNVNGQEIRTLKGHSAGVTRINFSPDSKTIVSASADQTIRLWNVETGQEIHKFNGHGYAFWNVSFSPDGKDIVSVSDDGLVELWSAEVLDFNQLVKVNCNWLHDFLQNNPNVGYMDKHICDGLQ